MKRYMVLGLALAVVAASTAVDAQIGGILRKKAEEVVGQHAGSRWQEGQAGAGKARSRSRPRACAGGVRHERARHSRSRPRAERHSCGSDAGETDRIAPRPTQLADPGRRQPGAS